MASQVCYPVGNYCCGTTARQAYERGYKVVFGSDVTATDDESRQEPELAVLRKGFALVLTADEMRSRLTAANRASEHGERSNAAESH
ncbi:isochorismatase family protein [Streptomyces sp. NPDC003710]